jgi:hypothetical protein
VSYAVDGGTVTDKIFNFGDNVLFKKIWFKVKLNGGGSNTPSLRDFVMEYLPVPSYKKTWALNVNCGDDVRTLDGALVETTGRGLKGKLETAWWTKSLLDFQDLDYFTTTLNGSLSSSATTITVVSTKDAPEQGRIKIEDEEVFYTGKTPTTFTGCIRGRRGTLAVAHNTATVVNNAYKVIISDFNVRVPILLQDKNVEYICGVTLKES